MPLARSLHREIVRLGKRLEKAAVAEEASRLAGTKGLPIEACHAELLLIIKDTKELIGRIDRDIPAIQLAITASGEKFSTAMPPGVSPSRLVQASTLLTLGDTQFAADPSRPIQIGPPFTLSLYMLFLGHASQPKSKPDADVQAYRGTPQTPERSDQAMHEDEEPYGVEDDARKPLWQEVLHKARVRLCRTPLDCTFQSEHGFCPEPKWASDRSHFGRSDEYSYSLEIIEDLDDGRAHDGEAPQTAHSFDDIALAGIREAVPVHQIAKIFYTDMARVLNIGNASDGENNPVLLLKRDFKSPRPGRTRESWLDDTGIDTKEEDSNTLEYDDDEGYQEGIDRQLREENGVFDKTSSPSAVQAGKYGFPQHLDQEWLALEVFIGDDEEEEVEDEDGDDSITADNLSDLDSAHASVDVPEARGLPLPKPRAARGRSSVDANLLAQIRNISLRPSTPPGPPLSTTKNIATHHLLPPIGTTPHQRQLNCSITATSAADTAFVARSPFGSITSSLSLLEMLIRLASLQIFQQMPHLAIPDHLLTFFLEETATTGLRGEERRRARRAARRRVGFDPYADTP